MQDPNDELFGALLAVHPLLRPRIETWKKAEDIANFLTQGADTDLAGLALRVLKVPYGPVVLRAALALGADVTARDQVRHVIFRGHFLCLFADSLLIYRRRTQPSI
jgi:hypothetical protein